MYACLLAIVLAAPPERPEQQPFPGLLENILRLLPPDGAELRAALKDLGHDSFQRRQNAAEVLDAAGFHALPYYYEGLKSSDVEIRVRSESGIARLRAPRLSDTATRKRILEYTLRRWPTVPSADAMWCFRGEEAHPWAWTYQENRTAWSKFWHKLQAPYITYSNDAYIEGPNWGRWRGATRLFLVDALDRGVPPWLLDVLLFEMFRRDEWFLSAQRNPVEAYAPPLAFTPSWPFWRLDD